MKVSELFETTKPGTERIKYDVQLHKYDSDPKDGIALMKKYASDAMWMLEKNRPIYRGTNRWIGGPGGEISIADPSKSERISSNTSNHYTVILDNHPEMKDFPKRSKSFIASTNYDRAFKFASGEVDNFFILIPFNGVKIGIVPKEDIWDLDIHFLGLYYNITGMNSTFIELGVLSKSIDDIKEYARKVKDNRRNYDEFVREFRNSKITDDILWNARQDLMKVIWDAYSPKHTGLSCETTATMDRTLPNNEVWIGGKCLVIKYTFWEKMVNEYNKL